MYVGQRGEVIETECLKGESGPNYKGLDFDVNNIM